MFSASECVIESVISPTLSLLTSVSSKVRFHQPHRGWILSRRLASAKTRALSHCPRRSRFRRLQRRDRMVHASRDIRRRINTINRQIEEKKACDTPGDGACGRYEYIILDFWATIERFSSKDLFHA